MQSSYSQSRQMLLTLFAVFFFTTLVLLLAMVAHIIKPLGLPGLKKRADFWKIAVFAFLAMMAVVVLQM